MSGIVITAYHRGRRRLFWSALISLAIAVVCGAYGVGQYRANQAEQRGVAESVVLRRQIVSLEEALSRVREQNALLERTAQVERETYQKLKPSVTYLQDQVAALKAEVAFYQTVGSSPAGQHGIRIGSFEAVPAGDGNSYHYRMVLAQVMSHDSVVEGSYSLVVQGLLDGAKKRLPMERIHRTKAPNLPFSFKYFESLEGELDFPSEFIPARVIVKIVPSDKKHEGFEESVEWPTEESNDVGQ